MQKFKINFFRYNLDSILVNWPPKISIEISTQINSFGNAILKNLNILELRKGYCSLLIIFKTEIDNYDEICNSFLEIYNKLESIHHTKKSVWEIPVCYEKQFSSDLEEYSNKILLSRDEIIDIHSSKIYYLHMYGFLPGFMYLGGLDDRLFISRKSIPSRRILKGSVAIGGAQTGIYPSDSPGGWYIIGKTPVNLFNTSNFNQPVIVPVANYIKFRPISLDEFILIENSIKNLEFKIKKTEYND
tara:strand:+ start:4952 stop:5683 length:732 start_codon:yes stop_codon:yes gene_type:complete